MKDHEHNFDRRRTKFVYLFIYNNLENIYIYTH